MFSFWALVKRELIQSLRKKRAFLFIVIFYLVAAGFLLAAWPKTLTADSLASGRAGNLILEVLSVIVSIGSLIAIAAQAGGAISLEREQETFDLLFLAPIRPVGIALAKLLNIYGYFLMLFLATLPLYAALFFMAGLDLIKIGKMFSLILISCLTSAAIGLFVSAFMRRHYAAVIVTFLAIAFYICGPFFILMLLDEFHFVRISSKLVAWSGPFAQFIGIIVGQLSDMEFLTGLATTALIGVFFFWFTCYFMKRPAPPPTVENKKTIDDPALLTQRRKQFPFYLIDPLKRKKEIPDQSNPMLVRELRYSVMARAAILLRAFYVIAIINLFLGAVLYIADYSYQIVVSLSIELGIILAVAPLLIANFYTRELELGNLDMLRMTLLSSRAIVFGKFKAGLIAISPLLVSMFLPILPLFFLGPFPAVYWAGLAATLVCVLIVMGLSMFASIVCRRTSSALVLSYLMSAIVLFGLSGIIVICNEIFGRRITNSVFRDFINLNDYQYLSPFLLFVEGSEMPNYGYSRATYHLGWDYWLALLCWALFGLFLVWASHEVFKRWRLRSA